MEDPRAARALPGAVPALKRLAGAVGTVAVITGRPAADAVAYGGLDAIPGLIVLGHYGGQRWQDGALIGPGSSPAVRAARQAPRTAPGSRTRDMRWLCTPAARPTRTRPWAGSGALWAIWPNGSDWPPNRAGW